MTSSVFKNTQSGAVVANEVVLHPGSMSFSLLSQGPAQLTHIYSVDGLPFGGIGPSGSKLSSHSMLLAWFIFTTQTATTVASIPSTCSLT